MIATCSRCSSKNRIPSGHARVRCGKCKVELSIPDLARAVNEAPPTHNLPDLMDGDEEDEEI